MITFNDDIVIEINGQEIDLPDASNIRMNLNLFDPLNVNRITNEYSFKFSIPKTNRNIKIFNFANDTAKVNKFVAPFNCTLYVDGNLFFKGSFRVSDIDEQNYNGNIVNIKFTNIDDILGDSKMGDIKWLVPYDRYDTINAVNESPNNEYIFPLVAYGAFQKLPSNSKNKELKEYSSLYDIDETTRFYHSSFIPHMNYLTLVRKVFESKGYNVSGDIFDDPLVKDIYLSSYIEGEQIPTYNLGKLGRLRLHTKYQNFDDNSDRAKSGFKQELEHKKMPALSHYETTYYNISHINKYDTLVNNKGITVKEDGGGLYSDGTIVIPSDGVYNIKMEGTMTLHPYPTDSFKIIEYKTDYSQLRKLEGRNDSYTEEDFRHTVYYNPTLRNSPIEIQMIVNGENPLELISQPDEDIDPFAVKEHTNFPHEPISSYLNGSGNKTIWHNGTGGGRRTTPVDPSTVKPTHQNILGKNIAYDIYANDEFVMGATTIGKKDGITLGTTAVIKNGKSWFHEKSGERFSRTKRDGYNEILDVNNSVSVKPSTYNKDDIDIDDDGTTANIATMVGSNQVKFTVHGSIYLHANDVLTVDMVTRYVNGDRPAGRWGSFDTIMHSCKASVEYDLDIQAATPNYRDIAPFKYWNWSLSNSKFGKDLNLGEFLHKGQEQRQFIHDFIDTFNLACTVEGNNIVFNKSNVNTGSYIDLDDRVNVKDIKILPIPYPYTYEVQFSIDDEEAGFYNSVVESGHINDDNWKDYAERGSEKVVTNNRDINNEEKRIALKKSYTWYHDFNLYNKHTVKLPVIALDENFIDGADYEEMMQKDGRSLKQRMFFLTGDTFNVKTVDGVSITSPVLVNSKDGLTLNYYRNDNTSLLNRYYTITKYIKSNYIEFEVFLTYDEYEKIKHGSTIKVDGDLYVVSSMQGFDLSGYNKTKITAIKSA